MPLTLPTSPLNIHAFHRYGAVLDLLGAQSHAINAGTSQRVDLPGGLRLEASGGVPALAVFRARAQLPEGPWTLLERHRLGTQTFVPLTGARCVLLVALGASEPDMATLTGFEVAGDQGFTLHAGTWHHPLIARDDGDFLVLERQGSVVDCDVFHLPVPVCLQVG